MLKLKTLTMKNFLSIGNATQTIHFNRNELVLVIGENVDMGGEDGSARNGCGKSGSVNALSYVLYGWAISNIKKEHLINKSNGKAMIVTLDFESNGQQYKIIRGRKPNILEFYQNGVKRDDKIEDISDDSSQGDSRETQKEIERVIGMSHDMFCQIIALNTYTTPFLFQRVHEQRAIIEQLLGITLLSEKAEKLKEEIKLVKEDIIREETRIKGVEAANKRIQDQIDSVLRKQKIWNRNKNESIESLNKSIQKLSMIDIDQELLIHSQWDEYNKISNSRISLSNQKKQINIDLTRESNLLNKLNDDLKSLDNQCCHTCKQKIKSDIHETLSSELLVEKDKCMSIVSQLQNSLTIIQVNIDTLPLLDKPEDKKYNTLPEVYDHKNKLALLVQEYDSRVNEVDPFQDQILDMKNSALETVDLTTINSLTSFSEHQEFLVKLLTNKDSFIRKKIIEQNLSYLNSRLAHYLVDLGLPHTVIFQNDLNVDISELGRELSPGNLSRGEMARLSLGLSFSFRDVFESLYQPSNLFFIDELLDNGLDIMGSQDAMKLLLNKNRDQGKDIWVISHRDELISKANKICIVKKENGFSTFSFEEE